MEQARPEAGAEDRLEGDHAHEHVSQPFAGEAPIRTALSGGDDAHQPPHRIAGGGQAGQGSQSKEDLLGKGEHGPIIFEKQKRRMPSSAWCEGAEKTGRPTGFPR